MGWRCARIVLAIAALGCAVGLAGCGQAGPGVMATAPPGPTAPPAAVVDRLRRQLLSAADLPLGFQPEQAGGPPSALGCAGIDRLYLTPAATPRVSATFAHAFSDEYLDETITTPGSAASALEAFGRVAVACRTFAGAGRVAYQVTALPSMPSFGNGSAAVQVTAALAEARPVDLVAVRVGDTVLVIAHANARRVDHTVTAALTRLAVDKLRSVR